MTALWLFPLSASAKLGGWGGRRVEVGDFCEGMPVWAKNVENVQERRRLDHRV